MRVLLIPGSRRQDSLNVRLLTAVAAKMNALGVDTDLIAAEELNIPLYDGDCEAEVGIPDSVKALNRRLASADAIVVASPEYNGFFSPLLKNTLDWMSRSQDGEPGMSNFRDKPGLVLAASPGAMAAARALPHIRTLISNFGVNVYRAQLGVGKAGAVLSPDGRVTDPATDQKLDELVEGFTRFAAKLI